MRRWSLIAESSSFHLTNSSKRHVCIFECMKLRFRIWVTDTWHDANTQFHEFPCSVYLVIKYVQTDIPSYSFVWNELCYGGLLGYGTSRQVTFGFSGTIITLCQCPSYTASTFNV
jgi:hypothetical protein